MQPLGSHQAERVAHGRGPTLVNLPVAHSQFRPETFECDPLILPGEACLFMGKPRVNVCSQGDPTSPKTWSGTPHNLVTALKSEDRFGLPIDASAASHSRLRRKLTEFLSSVRYPNSIGVHRGTVARAVNAARAAAETEKTESKLTLHTGTMALPFGKVPFGQKHYLFIDSSWNLWSSASTDRAQHSEKLLQDAENLERLAYEQAAHIFPISEYVKENLVEQYGVAPSKITPVGTGLGVIKPYHGLKDYGNGRILFAAKGRFEDKGGPLVLEAFQIAQRSNPSLTLTIVGQNDYTDKIDLPGVTTHGFIPIEQLQSIFEQSSLFLMPAQNEPWGLVYLEAMACKMPIVGLNRNSFPELSGHGNHGIGLERPDPEALAKVLADAFANPGHLADLGEKAQTFCLSTYTWEAAVARILEVIDRENP